VELQHETAPRTARTAPVLRAATAMLFACVAVRLGIDHSVISVANSFR
jgi:hypothetical protein